MDNSIDNDNTLNKVSAVSAKSEPTRSDPERTPRSSWYVLFILCILYINSVFDRIIITMAVPALKRDLDLSDFQISLLIGPAFMLSYCIFSLPFGSMVDRVSRRFVVWAGVTFWSAFAMICGLAKNAPMLFIGRIGVGAGEASLSPAAYSMFSDIFPRRRLTFAASVFAASSSIGTAIAFVAGGWLLEVGRSLEGHSWPILGQIYSWQFTFLVTAIPGFFLALLVYTFREPKRKGPVIQSADSSNGMKDLWIFLKQRKKLFVPYFIGFCCASALANAVMTWTPTYFAREFGLSMAYIGSIIGAFSLTGALLSHTTKGLLIDYFFGRGVKDCHLRMYLYSAFIAAPVAVSVYFVGSFTWAIIGLGLVWLVLITFVGYASAGIQLVTPQNLRGKMAALFIMAVGGIGFSTGPMVVAFFTDFVFRSESLLRYSLAISVALFSIVAVIALTVARKPFMEAITEQEQLM